MSNINLIITSTWKSPVELSFTAYLKQVHFPVLPMMGRATVTKTLAITVPVGINEAKDIIICLAIAMRVSPVNDVNDPLMVNVHVWTEACATTSEMNVCVLTDITEICVRWLLIGNEFYSTWNGQTERVGNETSRRFREKDFYSFVYYTHSVTCSKYHSYGVFQTELRCLTGSTAVTIKNIGIALRTFLNRRSSRSIFVQERRRE